MAQNPLEDLSVAVRDALYVGVGLGVLAIQRIQVQRQELNKTVQAVTEQVQAAAKTAVGTAVHQIEGVVARGDGAAR